MHPIPSLFITLPVAGFLGVRSSASSDFIATCGCLPNKLGFWLIPAKAQEARPLAEGQLPVAASLEQRTGASWKRDERAQWDRARWGHAVLQTPGEGQYFIRLGSHIQLQLVFRAKMGMSRYHQSLVRSGSCCLEVSTQTANKHPQKLQVAKEVPITPHLLPKMFRMTSFGCVLQLPAPHTHTQGWPPRGTMDPLSINTRVWWVTVC